MIWEATKGLQTVATSTTVIKKKKRNIWVTFQSAFSSDNDRKNKTRGTERKTIYLPFKKKNLAMLAADVLYNKYNL